MAKHEKVSPIMNSQTPKRSATGGYNGASSEYPIEDKIFIINNKRISFLIFLSITLFTKNYYFI